MRRALPGVRPRVCAVVLAALVALPLSAPSAGQEARRAAAEAALRARSPRAADAQLLDAIETSRVVVVGRIGQLSRLDVHGHAAQVWTEATLRSLGEPLEPGTPIQMAWEELSTQRRVRFREHDRVLVCLELLPTASIWRTRLPEPETRRQTYAVALGGDAYLHAPSAATLDVLTHYLALPAEDRMGDAGVAALLSLVEHGEAPLALSAATQLARFEDLDARLSKAGAAQLARALSREDAEGKLGDAIVKLISHRGGPEMQRALERELRRRGDEAPPPPRFYDALGAVAGVLPKEDEERLLESRDPELRAVAARNASGPGASETLRALVTADPAAPVRAAAMKRLVALDGEDALEDALDALADEDALVRNTAARSAGGLGAAGVAGLRAVVFAGVMDVDSGTDRPEAPETARSAAVLGLGTAGRPGRKVLIEVAKNHPDESVKRLAALALGYGRDAH